VMRSASVLPWGVICKLSEFGLLWLR
jgi:hypothetical protein